MRIALDGMGGDDAPRSVVAVFRCLAWKKNRDAVEVFLEKAMTGVGAAAGDAVAALHRFLIANASRRARVSQGIVFALTIKAWNADLARKGMARLSYRPGDEAFPKVAS